MQSLRDRRRLEPHVISENQPDQIQSLRDWGLLEQVLQTKSFSGQPPRKFPGNPGARADGRCDVNAWRAFMDCRRGDDTEAGGETSERLRNIFLRNYLFFIKNRIDIRLRPRPRGPVVPPNFPGVKHPIVERRLGKLAAEVGEVVVAAAQENAPVSGRVACL